MSARSSSDVVGTTVTKCDCVRREDTFNSFCNISSYRYSVTIIL